LKHIAMKDEHAEKKLKKQMR